MIESATSDEGRRRTARTLSASVFKRSRPGGGQYWGKANHPRCNCMRPAKTIRVKNKYSVCVVLEVYARKDESPPPHVQTNTGFNMGVMALPWGRRGRLRIRFKYICSLTTGDFDADLST
jgi:hypothetical protein